MMIKKNFPLVFFFCLFSFALPLTLKAAETENICAQKQCVKLQDGSLWVLSSDNVTYRPYFVKAVGYEPTPIGRFPNDWSYAPGDPRSANNNIYDDPEILNRDFSLLQQMNANTIRIWKGNNTKVSCACSNNGRFPDYMTNADLTANVDKARNTLDLAASYGLKVIAGFGVNTLTFDANNNIGSIDEQGNPLSRQDIINNFVNYVDTFKANRAILFWVIGNENNYQRFGQSNVSRSLLESRLGLANGDAIYNWLHENNYVHFNNGLIIDVNTPEFKSALQAKLIAIGNSSASDYNIILNDLIAASGVGLTAPQLSAWFSLVNDMAQAAHNAEGANFHPVAVVNGGIAEIGNAANGTTDSQMTHLDIWGTNVYLGRSFGALFQDYFFKSAKPLWISEFGVDAWTVIDGNGINDWGLTAEDDTKGTGRYDPDVQSAWDTDQWREISNNFPKTLGGSVMEYSDEWWKFYEWYCTSPSAPAINNAISSGICNSIHKYYGFPKPDTFPDGFSNEEWYGVVGISLNPSFGNADVVSPRAVYYGLQGLWRSNPWASLSLNITGSGAGTITSSTSFGPGLNCSYSSGSSTGSCSAGFVKNQPVILNFSSSNNSTVTNWGISGCTGGSNTCSITPDTDITVNITETASVVPTVELNSYIYSFTAPTVVYLVATAAETGGNISKVEFYNGSTLINTVTTPQWNSNQYSYLWFNLTPGNYSITAKAYDNNGQASTSAPKTFAVSGIPVVTLSSAVMSAPATVVLTATASEAYGTISQVSFYNGSTLLGTAASSPFFYTWFNIPSGIYNNVTAVATDTYGVSTTSAPITVAINAGPLPSVSISSPSNNASYALPVSIPLTASAFSPNGAISNVSFYNGSTLIGVGTGSGPYVFNWNDPAVGVYNVTAVVTDVTGAQSISPAVSITVNPHIAPTVSITSPSNNSTYVTPSSIALTANATASNATIAQVAFYNGASLLGIATGSGPYTFNWSAPAAGVYNITAVATDSTGAKTTSEPIAITVNSNLSPTVDFRAYIYNFTAPAVVYMTANATETGGSISKVEFYNGAVLVATITEPQWNSSLYSYLWFNLTPGNYSLTAKAYDSNNHVTTSLPYTFTVTSAPAGGLVASGFAVTSSLASIVQSPGDSVAASTVIGYTPVHYTIGIPANGKIYSCDSSTKNELCKENGGGYWSAGTPQSCTSAALPVRTMVYKYVNGSWVAGPNNGERINGPVICTSSSASISRTN